MRRRKYVLVASRRHAFSRKVGRFWEYVIPRSEASTRREAEAWFVPVYDSPSMRRYFGPYLAIEERPA